MVAWESLLERDALYLFEFSPGVVSYREQPTLIQYSDGERIRDYYPDFELVLEDESRVHVEVKSSAQLSKPKVRAKLLAIARHYERKGLRFRIATEREIRREPLLTNLRSLSYVRGRPGHSLPTGPELTRAFGARALRLDEMGTVLGEDAVVRLIAIGRIGCDLTKPLGADTTVAVSEGEHHATILL
ncbi:MAG: hypothetical protein A3H93_05785 [Rhodocyclales bacterium RIFCSPLOWO2_02_FULL_63_24]|nr:MAG: hypothetical protein A3H93_05785 [Rhodocyclales bacterium RIFCSPLOWO2_02_FULL_63_24]